MSGHSLPERISYGATVAREAVPAVHGLSGLAGPLLNPSHDADDVLCELYGGIIGVAQATSICWALPHD